MGSIGFLLLFNCRKTLVTKNKSHYSENMQTFSSFSDLHILLIFPHIFQSTYILGKDFRFLIFYYFIFQHFHTDLEHTFKNNRSQNSQSFFLNFAHKC